MQIELDCRLTGIGLRVTIISAREVRVVLIVESKMWLDELRQT